MRMLRSFIVLFCAGVFLFSGACSARADGLSEQQLDRAERCHGLLGGTDKRSFDQIVSDLERSSYPEENLQILEAVARTFDEIVSEQDIKDKKKREWLLSRVRMNMAYLQMGGGPDADGGKNPMDRMICAKLKKHLPRELFDQRDLFFVVE